MGLLTGNSPALAQTIVRDGAPGARANEVIAPARGSTDHRITEDLGFRLPSRPDILIHSFREFGLREGESATFLGTDSIDYVIARVTGGSRSEIYGALRSEIPDSRFFFINPAGVVFGQGSSLDMPGSFYVSTATQVRLEDGAFFDVTPGAERLLHVAAPDAFGFLNPTAAIEIVDTSL